MAYQRKAFPRIGADGFTLLEVMLVLLLMGLAAGFVVFNSVGTDPNEILEKQARRLQVLVNMASDFAVLNQQEIGLRINKDNQYLFLIMDENGRWQPLTQQQIFATTDLPEGMQIRLDIENLPWQEDSSMFDRRIFDESLSVSEARVSIGESNPPPPPPPQVMIMASGEITPFQIVWSLRPGYFRDRPAFFVLKSDDLPPLTLEGPLERAP